MSGSRLQEIKTEIAKMRELHANFDYSNGDQILIQLESRHLDWLVERAEKAESYENTLKYVQYELYSGGEGKRTRITKAVDKALEGISNE